MFVKKMFVQKLVKHTELKYAYAIFDKSELENDGVNAFLKIPEGILKCCDAGKKGRAFLCLGG